MKCVMLRMKNNATKFGEKMRCRTKLAREKNALYVYGTFNLLFVFFSSSEFFQIKKIRSYKQLAETNVVKMKNSSTGTVRRNKKKQI